MPDRLAITSVFGRPFDPRVWSGAPNNVATAFERLGVDVVDTFPFLTRAERALSAAKYMLSGYGRLPTSLSLFRAADLRRRRARRLAKQLKESGARRVLHTGTLDLPACDADEVDHYLYCDHTWDLWFRHRAADDPHTSKAFQVFDDYDRACYAQMRHIFTFGIYVRDNLISHYGVAPERVTAVGSGMGPIDPYFGAKRYDNGLMLFVAKHLFAEKGGHLVLEAFALARESRPDLRLAVVWDGHDAGLPRRHPHVEFHSHLRWGALTRLYRDASLFVQPMLNDPWGQVYLEALVSRTPVLGLDRNGLPEITENGRHGFLVDEPDAQKIALAMLDAMSDPRRLDRMGLSGQRHVLKNYSWDGVARQMAFAITARERATESSVASL
ncbi:glycosyltransferase family 4 protein [Parvibaculum sp.]|uniref:glycosyltransferase family 4 protein n=1 Tax=Parvibaculum sp. TaxID=2024848 RepID=UPI0025F66F34|nr:glycosyltransferase family 4 protein [Parvibaculum sp.]